MNVTHALTMNGRVHGELKDPVLSPRELIGQRLGLLDGVVRYSLSLWKLPSGIPFERVDLTEWPQEYIQAAGSVKAMTLELRRLEQERQDPAHFVVGRAGSNGLALPTEVVIPWDGCEARVAPSEVFSASEAAEVFASYYETGQLPAPLQLRPLAL